MQLQPYFKSFCTCICLQRPTFLGPEVLQDAEDGGANQKRPHYGDIESCMVIHGTRFSQLFYGSIKAYSLTRSSCCNRLNFDYFPIPFFCNKIWLSYLFAIIQEKVDRTFDRETGFMRLSGIRETNQGREAKKSDRGKR